MPPLKKIQPLLLFAFCVSITSAFAQDYIMLKNKTEIKALVQEVGETTVKYKRFDNPNGPNYTLRKSEVFIIEYANGTRDVFDETPSKSGPAERQPNVIKREYNLEVSPQQTPTINQAEFAQLKKNDIALREFFREHDPVLYRQFQKGASLCGTGKALLGVGLGLTGGGIVMMVAGANDMNAYNDNGTAMFITGYFILIVGQPFIIASIPLFAVGGSMKGRVVRNYERRILGNEASYQPTLNLGMTENGIGVILKF